MAKVVDPRNLPGVRVPIPGLKPPVRDFSASDDGDPAEVDAFNQMIRELRDRNPAASGDAR
jgi:hypothetical protein